MGDTYSQILLHIVFSVRGRQKRLHKAWSVLLYKYISGIIKQKGQKPILVNGVEDHLHILVGIKPNISVSDLVRDIKNNSSKWINNSSEIPLNHFNWQRGFGVFSFSKSRLSQIYNYVENQEKHHADCSFSDEYAGILKNHNIDFNEQYL